MEISAKPQSPISYFVEPKATKILSIMFISSTKVQVIASIQVRSILIYNPPFCPISSTPQAADNSAKRSVSGNPGKS